MPLARAERISGAYSTLNQKEKFFFFDSLGIDGLRNFKKLWKNLLWDRANDQG